MIHFDLDPDIQLKKTMKFLQKIEYYFRRTIANPQDKENLHKLRVNIRNFEVNFNYLYPFFPKYKRKIITSGLKVLKDCTDHLRDMDVFQEYIEKIFEIREGNEVTNSNGIDALYHELTISKQTYFLELQRIFYDFISFDFFKYWRTILKSHFKTSTQLKEKFHSIVVNKLKESWYEFETQIKNVVENEDELHQLRIAGKMFRYSFESMKDLFSEESQREIDRIMIDIQDSLGTINDCKMILQLLDNKKNKNNSNENPMLTTTISHRYFFRLIQEKKKEFQTKRDGWISSKVIDKISVTIYSL